LSIVSHGFGITPDDLPEMPEITPDLDGPTLGGTQWAHGGGGLAIDFTDAQNIDLNSSDIKRVSYLSTKELAAGLESSDVDILFLHACMMSMVEIIYEIRGHTEYIIAGENYLFGPGNYMYYLEEMGADIDNAENSEQIAINWANRYSRSLSSNYPHEVGVINNDKDIIEDANTKWQKLMTMLFELIEDEDNEMILGENEELRRMNLLNILNEANSIAQHFDYDYDLELENEDVYVDARGLALGIMYVIERDYSDQLLELIDFAEVTAEALDLIILESEKDKENPINVSGDYIDQSDSPHNWILESSMGLSVYFPYVQDVYVGAGCPADTDKHPDYEGCYSFLESYNNNNYTFIGEEENGWVAIVNQLEPIEIITINKLRSGLLWGLRKE